MARMVVEPLAGKVTFTRNGALVSMPIGLRSCVKLTNTPGSFTANTDSTINVAPATGDGPPTICNVLVGPRVSSEAKVETMG